MALFLLSVTSLEARADEPANPELKEAPVTKSVNKYGGRDKWENALDLKLTGIYGRNPTNITSPNLVVGAKWNYQTTTHTFFGLALSAIPQPMRFSIGEQKAKMITYYGGLNLAQGLFEIRPFRLVLEVAFGFGSAFIELPNSEFPSRKYRADYRFVEPGAFLTLFDYSGLEFGLTASSRIVRLFRPYTAGDLILGTDRDLSGTAFGITVRSQTRSF
jgi:hypothetical protein